MKINLLLLAFISVNIVSSQTTVKMQVFDSKSNSKIYSVNVSVPGYTEDHLITKTEDTWSLHLPATDDEQVYVFIFQRKDYYDTIVTRSVFAATDHIDLDINMRLIKTTNTQTTPTETIVQGFVQGSDHLLLNNVDVILKLSPTESATATTDNYGHYYLKVSNKKIPKNTTSIPIIFQPLSKRYEPKTGDITLISKQYDYHFNTSLVKRNTTQVIKGKAIKPADFSYPIYVTLSNDTIDIDKIQLDHEGNFKFSIDTIDVDPVKQLKLKFEAKDLDDTTILFTPRAGIPGLITLSEKPVWDRTVNSFMINISILPGLKDITYHIGYLYFTGGENSHLAIGAGLGYTYFIGHPIPTKSKQNNSNYDEAAEGLSLRSVYFGLESRYYYYKYNLKQPLFNPTAQLALYIGPGLKAKLLQPKAGVGTFINFTESIAALVEAQITMNFYDEPVFNYAGDYVSTQRRFIVKPNFNLQFTYIIPLE